MPFHSLKSSTSPSDSQLTILSLTSVRSSKKLPPKLPPSYQLLYPFIVSSKWCRWNINTPNAKWPSAMWTRAHGFLPTQRYHSLSSTLFSPIDCSHSHLSSSYHFFYLLYFTEKYFKTTFYTHCFQFFSLHWLFILTNDQFSSLVLLKARTAGDMFDHSLYLETLSSLMLR